MCDCSRQVTAHFIEMLASSLRKYHATVTEQLRQGPVGLEVGKECTNLTIVFAMLFNFKVRHATVTAYIKLIPSCFISIACLLMY